MENQNLMKAHSLMERMDKHLTKSQAEMLEEGIKKERKSVSRDKILDVLDAQDKSGRGKFVSITYVKPVSIMATKKNWDDDKVRAALDKHPDKSENDWYKTLSDFNRPDTTMKRHGIKNIVVTMRYNFQWHSPEKYASDYEDYRNKLSALRMQYGVAIERDGYVGDARNQTYKMGDETFNQKNNLVRNFNMANANVTTTNYILKDNGDIIGIIPNDIIDAIKTQKSIGVEKEVEEVLKSNPEALEEYKNAKKELDKTFKARQLLFDRILCIVATVDGVAYYYINDKITTPIANKSDVMVNQQAMKEIAENQLGVIFEEISSQEYVFEESEVE